MGVHLLGELSGELDRLHLRREGTAEHPLDEVLDALLKVSQNADAKLPSGVLTCARTSSGTRLPCTRGDNPSGEPARRVPLSAHAWRRSGRRCGPVTQMLGASARKWLVPLLASRDRRAAPGGARPATAELDDHGDERRCRDEERCIGKGAIGDHAKTRLDPGGPDQRAEERQRDVARPQDDAE